MKLHQRALLAMVVLVFSVLSPHADGDSAVKSKTFRLGRKDVLFTILPALNITISSDCVLNGKLKRCDASTALERADSSKMERDLFGRNPGAMICSEQVGGTVVWSRDQKGNERTFCKFKDGSLVSSGTLSHYGESRAMRAKSR